MIADLISLTEPRGPIARGAPQALSKNIRSGMVDASVLLCCALPRSVVEVGLRGSLVSSSLGQASWAAICSGPLPISGLARRLSAHCSRRGGPIWCPSRELRGSIAGEASQVPVKEHQIDRYFFTKPFILCRAHLRRRGGTKRGEHQTTSECCSKRWADLVSPTGAAGPHCQWGYASPREGAPDRVWPPR